MKNAESVTFGGSRLDRAAELRGDIAALDLLRQKPDAKALPIWRGKPLIAGDAQDKAGWLALDAAIFKDHPSEQIFLGLDDGAACFAQDISAWEPEGDLDAMDTFLDPTLQHYPGLPTNAAFTELRGVMTQLSARDAELIASAKAVMSWHVSHQFCAKCGAKSQMSMSGWQRDCATCGGHHFPRTDPVVIMLITHGNSCLMGRSPGWPEGMYSCLAGFVEPGETIEAAVRRETFEEAGIEVGHVDYLSSQPWPFPASLMIGCHGHATSTEITIDPNEIEDAIWVTREDMLETFAGNNPDMKPAREGAIAHFLLVNWLKDTLD
jgi:NAD+ diphosphatase